MTHSILLAVTALSSIMGPEGHPDMTAVGGADPAEPLRYARAYSVEIDENGNGTDGYYPLGVLGDRFPTGFNVFLGGNYSAQHVQPDSGFPSGTQGVYGVSITACQQAWLDKKLPKALGPNGKPLKRRPVNLFDPATLDSIFAYARATVTNAVAKGDARIFKWEIDNEFIPELDFSLQAVAAFRAWLPGWYKGDVGKFRKVWGTNYVDFADAEGIDPDTCRERPGPFMDWIRFQQETFAKFLADYCKAISDADPKHRPVNGKDTQSSLEMLRLARARRANHELIGEAILPYTHGVRGMDHYGHGDRNAYEMNFYAKTAADPVWLPGRRQGILYGENNNHNGPGWQWAETLWRMPANGLKGGNLFCSGWFGCWGDWASFGFVNPDGTKREKFWYLPRFFATIHRAERFFTTAAPSRQVPKVAMLLAQRDIPFGVDDNISPWGFPINSRLRVYSHLRDAGYAVDVIPYSHLKPACMDQYQALFLVSAEHLSDADIDNIRAYVRGGGVLFCDCRTGQFDEHNLTRTANDLSDVLGLRFKGIWESGDAVVDAGDVWFSTKYGRLLRGDGRINYEATTAGVWNKRDAFFYDNKAAVFRVNAFGKGRAYWTNTQMGTLRSESSDGEEPARDFFRTLLADAGLEQSYAAEPDRGCDLRVETPLVDGRGNAVVMLGGRTWRTLDPMKLTMRLPPGLTYRQAFLSLAEENRLVRLASRRANGKVTFDLPAIRSAAAIYLMGDHAPLLGSYFKWNGATTAEDEVTPLVKPGGKVPVVVQVANPSAEALTGAEVRLNALTGWAVRCVRPLSAVPAGEIGEAEFEVELPLEGEELRPNHVQPLAADLFVGGTRVAVTHTVVQADVDKCGHELLLSDNWVSADCAWSVWNDAEYRYLTTPDEAKGQKIEDALWTTHADGQKVYALQSGDRANRRRYATYHNLPKVELEWDLKKSYDVTRLLIRRGKSGAKLDPKSVAWSFSEDGRTFSEPVTSAFACDARGFVLIDVPKPARARYVRFAFDFGKKRRGMLEEIWIFGRIPETELDVVVYGGSSAGIAAAIEAKRSGKSVVLIEPSNRIGGLTTGGLGQTDIGNKAAFGGIALEFYRAVADWYRDPAHWTRQKREDYLPDGQCAGTKGEDSMWTFEPSAALAILNGWMKRDGIEVVYGERLDRSAGKVKVDEVKVKGEGEQRKIVSLVMESGRVFRGKMFVDATYEGDLLAAAGVSYTVGREDNSVYGETVSGIVRSRTIHHQFAPGVDPYVVKGDPSSGLLPFVEEDCPEPDGTGDRRVQAYCFRMCLTDDPENRIPFAKPEGYRELDYELLLRNLEAEAAMPESGKEGWRKGPPWTNSKMPNRKTDTNNRQAFASDFIGQNWAWPEASYAERDRILKAHLDYQKGLMWTLANHPRVPEKVRTEVARWGTCRDEFADGLGDGWQPQLYVREARRMVGDYVMTEHNCRGSKTVSRPVAMGAYQMDSHNCRRYVGSDGFVHNEGDVQDSRRADGSGRFRPYSIDYGAIIPKRGECANLLVPVCISASHMAFGSIRMEPAFFALGQVAGAAASIAIDSGADVQSVDYPTLRRKLLSEGQVVEIDSVREVLRTVNDRLAKEFLSADGLLLDYVGEIPTPEEIADLKPNAMGWWCPIENGSMFTGEWLPALMAEGAERRALVETCVRGLLKMSEVSDVPGFIARGTGTDGRSHHPCGSNDQTDPWFLGLCEYCRWPLADDALKAKVLERLVFVARALEANGWGVPCDGPFKGENRGNLNAKKMPFWGRTRLLYTLKSLQRLTGDAHWGEAYERIKSEALGAIEAGGAVDERTFRKCYTTGVWIYVSSAEALARLIEMEENPADRARLQKGFLRYAERCAPLMRSRVKYQNTTERPFAYANWRTGYAWRPQKTQKEAESVAHSGKKEILGTRKDYERHGMANPLAAAAVCALQGDVKFREEVVATLKHYDYSTPHISEFFHAAIAAAALSAGGGEEVAHEAEAYGEAFERIVARVRLWPGLAPGETNACRGRFAFDTRVKAWRRHDVTAPELVILKPQTVKHDTMVVVMPGGGYNSNYMGVIGANALPVLESGRWVAVLHYRIPRREGRPIYAAPREDAARAIRWLRGHAADYGFSPEKIGSLGFSAGGHLSAISATSSQDRLYDHVDELDDLSAHLDFAVAVYPAYVLDDGATGPNAKRGDGAALLPEFKFDAKTPPMLLLHGDNDYYSSMGSVALYRELHKRKIPAQLMIYSDASHGLNHKVNVRGWERRIIDWIESRGF